jgi:hypothetical protein
MQVIGENKADLLAKITLNKNNIGAEGCRHLSTAKWTRL